MNATPWLGANYIRDTTWFCCLALTVLPPLGEEVMRQPSPALGLSMPTLKITNGPLTLTQNVLCRQLRWHSQRQFQTNRKYNNRNNSNGQKLSCKATWSATARANLSILEPASAIFLAALITSEEFFRGPLPLGKFKEWEKMEREYGWSCRHKVFAEPSFKDWAHPCVTQACTTANLLWPAAGIWDVTISQKYKTFQTMDVTNTV